MPIAPALLLLVATLGGILLAPTIARNRGVHSVALAFAAGTLLTMVLGHVLPEVLAMNHSAGITFVLGFVGMLMMHQHVLRADPCCGHEHQQHAGLPSFLALALCSLNDGIVLSAGLGSGFASPLLWAMVVHEATAGFALALLLREVQGRSWTVSQIVYLLGFACVAPAALLVAGSMTGEVTWMPYLLGASAGALLYVVAGSLVPRVEHLAREGRTAVLAAFLGAVVVNLGLQFAKPHDHGGGTAHAHDHTHDHK